MKPLNRMCVRAICFLLVGPLAAEDQASSKAPPLSPAQCIATMQMQPGYQITPVLTEPVIHEPAAIAWDGNGRMYVVEMRTYMQDIDGKNQLAPTSRVSRHEDTNDDGIYDKHTVFADNLSLPRMVLPLLDRVIIRETNTLDLKSYQDTNGDGVADKVEMWHEGGGRGGNLEHQPSGLIWNVDNWLYTTYSRHRYRIANGNVIRQPLPHGAGQWGLTHDNIGRIYYSSAGGENPATDFQQPIIYGRLSLPGEQAPGFREVFPIDAVPDTQGGRGRLRENNTLNHFTASCGQSIFRGDQLPPDWSGDLIICEPVGRLIRRAHVLNEEGKVVVANAYRHEEFIAATDPNFRPVNSATGPDGCLYIVDMYRGIIQEGNWVREGSYLRGVVQQYELDRNVGRGRIYRVTHDTSVRGSTPRMLEETPTQLIAHLSHPNGWWRSEAQKLIVLHGDPSIAPALKRLATAGESAWGRFHALWTLEGLGIVDPQLLLAAMKDRDPHVRAAAVRIAEESLATDRAFDEMLFDLAGDPDPNVAIQVLLSASRGAHPDADSLAARIEQRQPGNAAVRSINQQLAAQREAMRAERRKLEELRRRNRLLAESMERGKQIYSTLCITCHGAEGKGVASPGHEDLKLAPPLDGSPRVRGHKERLTRILLNGLIGPVNETIYAGGLMQPMGANDDPWIADVATYIRNSWGNQAPLVEPSDVKRIRDESADRNSPWTLVELDYFDPPELPNRSQWVLNASHGQDKLNACVDGNAGSRWDTGTVQRPGMWFQVELPEPTKVLSVTLDTRGSRDDYPRGYIVQLSDDGRQWDEPTARGAGVHPVTQLELSRPRHAKFMRVTQTGQSPDKYWSIHELSIQGIVGEEPQAMTLADKMLAEGAESVARAALDFGDPARGAKAFYNPAFSCSKCHDPPSGAPRVGPNLAEKRDGVTVPYLVDSILSPSKVIRKGFETLTVVTDEGKVITGLPVYESEEVLEIAEPASGKRFRVAKDEIEGRRTGKLSAMPAGLANQFVNRQQVLDVVSFLIEIESGGKDRLQQLRHE